MFAICTLQNVYTVKSPAKKVYGTALKLTNCEFNGVATLYKKKDKTIRSLCVFLWLLNVCNTTDWGTYEQNRSFLQVYLCYSKDT
jgi:hypothetical protein